MTTIIPIPAFSGQLHLGRAQRARRRGRRSRATPRRCSRGSTRTASQLSAILATHHHADHVGGVRGALRALRRARVRACARDDSAAHARARRRRPHRRARASTSRSRVLDIPGHTAGHIAYFGVAAATRCCSAATRCSPRGCGRLFEGTPEQMWRRLSKLAALPRGTRVYCGHEYTLANLRFARGGRAGQRRTCARGSRASVPSASATSRRCRRRSVTSSPPIRSCARRLPARDVARAHAHARPSDGGRRRCRSRRCAPGRTTSSDATLRRSRVDASQRRGLPSPEFCAILLQPAV